MNLLVASNRLYSFDVHGVSNKFFSVCSIVSVVIVALEEGMQTL